MFRLLGARAGRTIGASAMRAARAEVARSYSEAARTRVQVVMMRHQRPWRRRILRSVAVLVFTGIILNSVFEVETEIVDVPASESELAEQVAEGANATRPTATVPGQQERGSRGENETGPRAEGGEGKESKPSFFIPYPFSETWVDPPSYSPNTPEFKEYTRISKDMDLQKRIRAETHVFVTRLLVTLMKPYNWGRVRSSTGSLFLVLPGRPPAFWKQAGIEINEDSITFGKEKAPMNPHIIDLTRRMQSPGPLLRAFYNHARAVGGQLVKRAFGWERGDQVPGAGLAAPAGGGGGGGGGTGQQLPRPSWPPRQTGQGTANGQDKEASRTVQPPPVGKESRRGVPSSAPRNGDSSPSPPSSPSSRPRPASTTSTTPPPRSSNKANVEEDGKKIKIPPGLVADLITADQQAWTTLQQETRHFFGRRAELGPRGSVKVTGTIRIIFEHGDTIWDVECWWDPRTEAVVSQTLQARLRHGVRF